MPSLQLRAVTPDYSREAELHALGETSVVGVDEAGRGPLAGPVVACAVWLDPSRIPTGLHDSKRLSQSARERLLNVLLELRDGGFARIGVGIAEPHEIERRNILWASLAAMERAVGDAGGGYALVDGNRMPEALRGEAVVKGDAKSVSIAAASICAKEIRDRLMREACGRFPGYGLSGHKGYPTRAHRQCVARMGPSPLHRWGFGGIGTVF